MFSLFLLECMMHATQGRYRLINKNEIYVASKALCNFSNCSFRFRMMRIEFFVFFFCFVSNWDIKFYESVSSAAWFVVRNAIIFNEIIREIVGHEHWNFLWSNTIWFSLNHGQRNKSITSFLKLLKVMEPKTKCFKSTLQ